MTPEEVAKFYMLAPDEQGEPPVQTMPGSLEDGVNGLEEKFLPM